MSKELPRSKRSIKLFKMSVLNFQKIWRMARAWILGNLKGINLKLLNVGSRASTLADFFVLGSATNTTQAKSMADEIVNQLRRHGIKGIQTEGDHTSDWILIER